MLQAQEMDAARFIAYDKVLAFRRDGERQAAQDRLRKRMVLAALVVTNPGRFDCLLLISTAPFNARG